MLLVRCSVAEHPVTQEVEDGRELKDHRENVELFGGKKPAPSVPVVPQTDGDHDSMGDSHESVSHLCVIIEFVHTDAYQH